MRDKALRFIAQNKLLDEGDRVLVALSGGADSVSLLSVLISIKEIYNLQIAAFHMNHMIRGDEALRDERFCRALCERLGVPFTCVRADVPAQARSTGESLELCGRRLRYEALERFADEAGCTKIATAHNRSDNTETVLMNLIRGTGIGGLCGIPVRRGRIIRPLLDCPREEIEAYCRGNGLDYVADSTNLDDAYTRNRLRLHILPALRELNPALDQSIARTAGVMRGADDYLNRISEEGLKGCKTAYGYSCEKLLQLDAAILSYAVKRIVEEADAPVDSRHIALIIEKMRNGGAVDLGSGYRAVCAQGILRIDDGGETADDDDCVPAAEFLTERRSMAEIREAFADQNERIHKKFLNNIIPCDIITDDTVVRRRRAGDTFTDPDRGVTKTLRKLFNELKIPRERRGSIPVIAAGSTVLWIQGVGTSKQARIAEDFEGDVWLINMDIDNV